MSHDLLRGAEGEAAFAFNADRGDPWHKLGTPMVGDQTAEDILKAAHADFEVRLEPIYVAIDPYIDEATGDLIDRIQVPDHSATVATNPFNGLPMVLGDVGSKYTVMQNSATLDFVLEVVGASKGDAVLDTVGVLGGGKRFFAYLSLDALVIDPGGINDKIARGIGVLNSHDGSTALTVCNTDTRMVCANTVAFGLRNAVKTFKAKHTATIQDRAMEAQRALNLSSEWGRAFTQMAEELLAINVTADIRDRVLTTLYPKVEEDGRAKTIRDNKVDAIQALYTNDRNAALVGSNGWALYNAIGEWHDHFRGSTAEGRALASMDDGSWVSKAKVRAQEVILQLA